MNKEEIVAVVVRLFAIALGIYGLNNLPGMVMYFDQDGMREAAYIYAGLSALIVIVAILLWKFPLTVAKILLPKTGDDAKVVSWSYEEVLTCGFIIMGFYFLYYVISDSIYWFYMWKSSVNVFVSVRSELNIDQLARIYATVAKFVVSLVLIVGSRGLASMVLMLRYAALNSSKE
ncbi:hypothetical protein A3194_05775 [Candidatus Thiodiazotropha endoloripes]|uniref:hypothetical protein n=1 Tax=Candidatus Thiodiazotropha endoloripes TaxID=1818881 RepID=UPI00083E5DD2|nr:hypothetical protein [Candidatus Thiodiazotropha endoloripes]ODB94159.1 hypothetical protein A3194_05775 [Candidatus Thiodiazotropha endoloripes]